MGCGQIVLHIIRLNTLVDIIRVPKVRTSGELLPIDTNFVSILLLVSVLFFADFLVHTVKFKANLKDQIPGKLVTSGISDVATASVHSEKTWAKKWIIIIIIMNKSQEMSVFHRRQKLTSAMKQRPEK